MGIRLVKLAPSVNPSTWGIYFTSFPRAKEDYPLCDRMSMDEALTTRSLFVQIRDILNLRADLGEPIYSITRKVEIGEDTWHLEGVLGSTFLGYWYLVTATCENQTKGSMGVQFSILKNGVWESVRKCSKEDYIALAQEFLRILQGNTIQKEGKQIAST